VDSFSLLFGSSLRCSAVNSSRSRYGQGARPRGRGAM
jgi:hypothetical protein